MRHHRVLGLLLAVAGWAADNPPGSAGLSGSVVNALTGEPLKKAQVTLDDAASERTYAAATDDAGAFTLASLEPGAYELIVQKRGFVQDGKVVTLKAGQTPSGENIRLVPQGVVTGRIADRAGDPVAGVTIQAIQASSAGGVLRYSIAGSATTNDLGEYRIFGLNPGRYYLGGAYRAAGGYAAVYFPDAREATRAVPIQVLAGGEVQGINLTIGDLQSLRVRGAIQGPPGLPVQGLMIVAAPCDAGPLNRATTTVREADGTFELRDLIPGCYVLAADSFSGGRRFSARQPLTVAEKNLEDLHLTLRPPTQLTGRVRSEGTADFPFREVIVTLDSRFSKVTAGGAAAQDGSLSLNNVVPEIYELNVVVPEGYYLKSARLGAIDVMQSGLDLTHGIAEALDLEIGGDGGLMEGIVTGKDDQPIEGARVALVADHPAGRWPRPKVAVTDAQGTFRMRGIAPGDYKVYASQKLDVSTLEDAASARQVASWTQSVSIHEHAAERLRIKAIPADSLPVR